ncbi:hypothetical protein CDAR_248961 [Caerostris darwini]|uniref:Uncharacterized protein n=1 Tax=Caerostris darwini TaxID=1538125 RepID=A0AAV4R7F6_9ARAC|nr:hypothetical protein CDAR_248961 [Caerostris darwini]
MDHRTLQLSPFLNQESSDRSLENQKNLVHAKDENIESVGWKLFEGFVHSHGRLLVAWWRKSDHDFSEEITDSTPQVAMVT